MTYFIRQTFGQQCEVTISKTTSITHQARPNNSPVQKDMTCERHSLRVCHLHLITVWNILEPFLITYLKVLNVITLLIITVIFRLRLITIVILDFSGEFCSSNILQRQRRIQVNIITKIIMGCVTHYLLDVPWNGSILQLNLGNIVLQDMITLQDIEFQQMHTRLLGIY